MKGLFAKFYRIVVMRIFSQGTVLLLEWKTNTHTRSTAEIKPITSENLKDARSFQSEKQIRLFARFLIRGHKGFYAYLDNACVHRSWVVTGPGRVLLHKFFSHDLKASEVFIQYCETAPSARGKNIFAHVLNEIAQAFSHQRVLTSVDVGNLPSRRSMEKAGFVEVERIKIMMILGVRFVSHEQ
jgi:hypothetical protein